MCNIKSTIEDCKIINLDKVFSENSFIINFLNSPKNFPFDIKRIFYLYDIPVNLSRGAHAHKQLQQFIASVMGSFAVTIDDGTNKKTFKLEKPDLGLYVPPLIWVELADFSINSIVLVLTSDVYKEQDYIRNYKEFLNIRHDI